MPEGTWYKRQKEVCQGLEKVGDQFFLNHRMKLKDMCERGDVKYLTLGLNGAWTHRGKKPRMHSFICREIDRNEVVLLITKQKEHKILVPSKDDVDEDSVFVKEYKIVKTGNYVGSSIGMEGVALEETLEELQRNGLLQYVKYICTDESGTVINIIRGAEGGTHIILAHDPGHRQKNLLRSLKDKLGEGKYKTFAYRIGKFYMRCIKRAESQYPDRDDVEQRKTLFLKLWKFVYTHYINKRCVAACPCNEFYSDTISDDDLFEIEGVERVMSSDEVKKRSDSGERC